MKKKHYHGTEEGFSLLELLVGMALFILVIAVIISVFLSLLRSQKQHMQAQNVVDNGRFALEKVSRAVRQGKIYVPGGGPLPGAGPLNLCHPSIGYSSGCSCLLSRCLDYALVNGRIMETSGDAGGNPVSAPLTSSDLWVNSILLFGTGIGVEVAPSPQIQQKVTISFFMVPSSSVVTPEFVVQTTVSPRKLEI